MSSVFSLTRSTSWPSPRRAAAAVSARAARLPLEQPAQPPTGAARRARSPGARAGSGPCARAPPPRPAGGAGGEGGARAERCSDRPSRREGTRRPPRRRGSPVVARRPAGTHAPAVAPPRARSPPCPWTAPARGPAASPRRAAGSPRPRLRARGRPGGGVESRGGVGRGAGAGLLGRAWLRELGGARARASPRWPRLRRPARRPAQPRPAIAPAKEPPGAGRTRVLAELAAQQHRLRAKLLLPVLVVGQRGVAQLEEVGERAALVLRRLGQALAGCCWRVEGGVQGRWMSAGGGRELPSHRRGLARPCGRSRGGARGWVMRGRALHARRPFRPRQALPQACHPTERPSAAPGAARCTPDKRTPAAATRAPPTCAPGPPPTSPPASPAASWCGRGTQTAARCGAAPARAAGSTGGAGGGRRRSAWGPQHARKHAHSRGA